MPPDYIFSPKGDIPMGKLTGIAGITLALLLTLGMTAWAAGTEEGAAAEDIVIADPSWTTDTSPITLTFFFDAMAGSDSNLNEHYGDDEITSVFVEETGVDFDMTFAPDSDQTALNVLIASGDLPDMMRMSHTLQQATQLVQRGLVWDLDELSQTYAPKYMDNWDSRIRLYYRMHFDDMGFSFHPAYYVTDQQLESPFLLKAMQGVTVLKEVYEHLGSPPIENTDDYVDLLRRVKQEFPELTPVQSLRGPSPDNDGNPQLVSRALGLGGLNQRFFKGDDGVWFKYWEHPDFVKVLQFANTLFNEQLVARTEFTEKQPQLWGNMLTRVFSELNEDADNAAGIHNNPTFIEARAPLAEKIGVESLRYIMLPAFTIEPHMTYEIDDLRGGVGGSGTMITKQAERPDRAIQWLDYLAQELTQKRMMYGIEGVHSDPRIVDGWDIPLVRDHVQEYLAANPPQVSRAKYGLTAMYLFRDKYTGEAAGFLTLDDIGKELYSTAFANYTDLTQTRGVDNYRAGSEEEKIGATIKDYYGTQIFDIISGPGDEVQAKYDEMIGTMRELGLDVLNAWYTQVIEGRGAQVQKYSVGL